MSLSLAIIEDFSRLFAGNMNAYGVHIDDPAEVADETGKKRGKNFTKENPVTIELYTAHLKGQDGLGVIPVDRAGMCSFAVLDVDVYGSSHKAILDVIHENNLPLVPFRSKSGGLHLYIFFSAQEKASRAIEIMQDFRILLMLDKKTEIFPKQSVIKSDEAGNWINIPYRNCDNTLQYAIGRDGEALTLEEALLKAKNNRISIEAVENEMKALPLFDAPPCIQAIYLRKTTNNRNNYLMSMSTYYKAKVGDDFEYAVIEANNMLDSPIDLERLMKTVINSQKKRNYSYLCKEEPICSICYKNVCKKRKYGIGGSEISELSYEEFIQYDTDPPYYEWVINGKGLKFFDETDMVNQAVFRQLCFRHLHILPMRLSDASWTHIMNTALSNVVVKHLDVENSMSTGAMFMAHLAEFMTKRAPAMTRSQVLVDRVYKDNDVTAYIFKPRVFYEYLVNQKNFRVYSATQVQDKLKTLGGMPMRYYVSQGNDNIRVWALPFDSLEKYVETATDKVEVDFMEDMNDEPY